MSFSSRTWSLRFIRNLLLWLIPAAIVWALATPFYNQFLARATESLLRIVESPDVSSFMPRDAHYAVITRADLKSKGLLYSIRVTDTHFPVVLTMAIFLSVPGIRLSHRFNSGSKSSGSGVGASDDMAMDGEEAAEEALARVRLSA